MITYTIPEVLNNIDSRLAAVLLAGGMIFVGAFIQYLEGIRLGFRDRTHAIPAFANMYFFAHDLVFVGLFTHWFVEVDHWLFKLFWFGILIFTLLECIVHYQTIKFSRQELFPDLNRRQYIIVYVALQVAILGLFIFIYSHLDDPLFLISIATTEIISNVFNISLLRRRRNRKGQSFLLAWGLLLGSNIGFFFLFLPLLSNAFVTPIYYATGILVTAMNLIYMFLLTKYPAYKAHNIATGNQQHLQSAKRLPA